MKEASKAPVQRTHEDLAKKLQVHCCASCKAGPEQPLS